jgi:hypothetical protein
LPGLREKPGFVPNVLRACAFDNKKLKAFIDMVDESMLGESRQKTPTT